MLDDGEMDWLDEQMRGDVDHLLIGTSLPFLLGPGPALRRGVQRGARPGGVGRSGPQGRRDAAAGARPRALGGVPGRLPGGLARWPSTSPAASAGRPAGTDHVPLRRRPPQLRVRGAPDRGRVPRQRPDPQPDHPGGLLADPQPDARRLRFLVAVLAYGVAGPIGHVVAQSAKVADAPLTWKPLEGPWFDNNLATLEVTGSGLRMWWATGVVARRPARPPATGAGLRGERRLHPLGPRLARCNSCWPPRPLPASRPSAAPASSRW